MAHNPLSATVLERSGVSALGARQVLEAQVVASPEDRRRLAQIFAHLCGAGAATGPWQTAAAGVENDETHWVGRDRLRATKPRTETVSKDEKITIHMNRTELVQKFGLSAGGAQQVATGMPVTSAGDRTQIAAALLRHLREQGPAYVLPCIEQDNLFKQYS